MQTTVRTNYDSQFCGNVPLNFVNTIQSYGVLMVLEKDSMIVKQASENTAQLLNTDHSDIISKNFLDLILPSEKDETEKVFKTSYHEPHFTTSFAFGPDHIQCIANVHVYENQFIAEIEPGIKRSEFSQIYQKIKHILAEIQGTNTSDEVCCVIAKELKIFSGFDKVMIYQFDENWNGFVIAEEKESDMDYYLGLHFPASDIPKQARALYLNNPYRWIPDVSYEAVKLSPALNPITYTFTDLSACNLRSVPAVHLEYLSNMKVGSSMSTPIIKNGKLWGLISCHHKKPKTLSNDIRSAFVLVSSIFSSELSSKEREKELQIASRTTYIQSVLSKNLSGYGYLPDKLIKMKENIFELLEINGFTLIYKDHNYVAGNTFSEEHLKELLFWLKINQVKDIYSSDHIPFNTNSEFADNEPRGFIVIPFNYQKGYYFIGFRPEIKQTLNWGGNPNEAIKFEKDNKTYHPRNSFNQWQETVANISSKWEIILYNQQETLKDISLKTPMNIFKSVNRSLSHSG